MNAVRKKGEFEKQLISFLDNRESAFQKSIAARSTAVPAFADKDGLKARAEEAVESVQHLLEGKTGRQKDEIIIAALKPVYGNSLILATEARRSYQLDKLRAHVPEIVELFNHEVGDILRSRTHTATHRVNLCGELTKLIMADINDLFPPAHPTGDHINSNLRTFVLSTRQAVSILGHLKAKAPIEASPSESVIQFQNTILNKISQITDMPRKQLSVG